LYQEASPPTSILQGKRSNSLPFLQGKQAGGQVFQMQGDEAIKLKLIDADAELQNPVRAEKSYSWLHALLFIKATTPVRACSPALVRSRKFHCFVMASSDRRREI
jgi:hypothetical protein